MRQPGLVDCFARPQETSTKEPAHHWSGWSSLGHSYPRPDTITCPHGTPPQRTHWVEISYSRHTWKALTADPDHCAGAGRIPARPPGLFKLREAAGTHAPPPVQPGWFMARDLAQLVTTVVVIAVAVAQPQSARCTPVPALPPGSFTTVVGTAIVATVAPSVLDPGLARAQQSSRWFH
ncbi:hypothetical protein FRC08_014004 [Ceratobasidium sp. 394]|nr:hypothetical protein FRC08_014004 [Ceratobasidium sp. 394]